MYNIKTVKVTELLPTITDLLVSGKKVRITVTGDSMEPFLRESVDSVELSDTSFKRLHFGQIVLIKRNNGQIILHRVVLKKKQTFYIAGDAQNWVEGPLLPDQLIAGVTNVWRKQKCISCLNWFWIVASFLWWLRFPIRYLPRKVKKLIKIIGKDSR